MQNTICLLFQTPTALIPDCAQLDWVSVIHIEERSSKRQVVRNGFPLSWE